MTEKERLKNAFLEGYETGYGVEELDSVDVRFVENFFERWYKREYKEGWGNP